MLGGQRVSFLVDSGAAVSVVSYDILPPSARSSMNGTPPLTIGANGIPLDVLGIVNVMVDLETIKVHHDFVVARKLTVECLLGMDFLSRHGAVIDCSNCKLTLAVRDEGKAGHEGREHEGNTALVVNLVQTTKIPARSQVLVLGRIGSLGDNKGEGLIEPIVNIQRGILVARSVCKVDDNSQVPLQIVNTGLTDAIVYESSRVATFTVGSAVMTLGDNDTIEPRNNEMPEVDLTGAELTEAERAVDMGVPGYICVRKQCPRENRCGEALHQSTSPSAFASHTLLSPGFGLQRSKEDVTPGGDS